MDLAMLKNQRNGHKGRITYFNNQFEEHDNPSIGELQSMLHRLRVTYAKFDQVQSAIENIDTDPNVMIERNKFEETYGSLESKVLNQIYQLEFKSNLEIKTTSVSLGKAKENDSVNTTHAIKLPEIVLPKFDGTEVAWLNFRDTFSDLIHNNVKLDQTTKFHYLISCLRDGKAFQLIESLPVTSQNYNIAWKTVFDHFNNEVSIQKLHMKSIYDIKRPVEGSAPSLKLFIESVLIHVNALKNMGIPIDEWNLFLIHHLCERLDTSSHTQIIKSTQENTILSFKELIDILKKRVRILGSVKQCVNQSNSSASISDNRVQKQYNSGKPKHSFVSNEISCIFCHGNFSKMSQVQ